MIEKKIIQLNAEDFAVGAIRTWKNFLFVFDVTKAEMLQLSPSYEIIRRIPLTQSAGIKQIDTVFFTEETLVAADSLSKKFYRWSLRLEPDKTVSISGCTEYPLPPGSIITAAAFGNDKYYLLDKGNSMIRVYDREFRELKTIGSRMGYMYEEERRQRLGFEFPEDMVISEDRFLVSDSGNKRLVVIDGEGKQENVIKLPEFPYKFVFCEGDRVVVSDFDRSVMMVSLKYGFICLEELDYPGDFFPAYCAGDRALVGSEHSTEDKNELVELKMPDTSVETLAKEAGNMEVLMKVNVDEGRVEEAREIVLAHPELLPEYASYTVDHAVENRLIDYVSEAVKAVPALNKTLREDILRLSVEFIKKYKAIPSSDDSEAANIDKENIRHRMFLKLKEYRSLLRKVSDLKRVVREYRGSLQVLNQFLEKRFLEVKQGIVENLEGIENNLLKINESDLLGAFVHYWLYSEEEEILFRDLGLKYEKLFGNMFLLAILNDFYYSIAELFLKRGKIEQYISFADREISMYPDKMGIFKTFCTHLIALGKYDDVLRMLKKFPDKNKEDVNYFYCQVCLGKGDTDQAFFHLKKELDLYSHRVNLIPKLIALNKLTPEEARQYIDGILEKSGHSIDTYLHVAESFLTIGDLEKAEFYVDKELALFPENKDAVMLKLGLFYRHSHDSYTTLGAEYYKKCWEIFNAFMVINKDEIVALQIISFFLTLSYIKIDKKKIGDLLVLREKVLWEPYKREITIYLSFLKFFHALEIGEEIDKFENEVYIGAYSTGVMAYDYFFQEVKRLKDTGELAKMFDLTEKILKYHPGDKKVFKFLDKFEKSVGDEPGR